MGQSLFGREVPLARLGEWLTGRVRPTGGVAPAVLVSGEAGMGKTALVRAALSDVAPVRWAAAVPWPPAPFALLDQVVPEVARGARPGAVEPETVRAALLAGGQPLVVVLEDLHWADDATLELLAPLVDALAGDPVAVIGTYRSDELPRGHLVRRVRAQLRHRRQLTEIALGPLDATAVVGLVADIVGGEPAPALAAAVLGRTEGVPFFVEELLAALRAAGWLVADGRRVGLAPASQLPLPDTVRDAVLLRVAGLAERSRDVLGVAAVIGTEFDAATAATVAGGAWPDDLDHCGLLITVAGSARRFRHALIQEAVYSELPWSRRRTLHLAIADRLAGTGAPPGAVARHLLAGRALDRARPALVAAADRQLQAFAYRDAARLLNRALEVWPPGLDEAARLVVVDRLARCAELSGDHSAAIASLRELLDGQAASAPSPTDRADGQRRLAIQYELLGHWPLALTARETAAQLLDAAGRPGEAAVERLAIAAHLRSAASFRAALEVLDAAEASAAAVDRTELICRIGGLRGNVLARMGRAEAGVPQVMTALDLALAHGHTAAAAEIYQRLADSLEHAGDYRGAGRAYETAFEFCQTHDQASVGQLCRACATVVLFHTGRWSRALTHCGEVLADAAATDHSRTVAAGVAGLVHAMQGQATAARTALLDSRATAGRIDLVALQLFATWGLALLDETAGHHAGAAESYRQVVARCRETEERHYCVAVLPFAVARFATDRAVADLGAATAILADAVARTGQPEARAAFAHALAESDLAASHADQAMAHFRHALGLLDGLDLPIMDALVRYRAGLALLDAEPDAAAEAADLLRAAHRTAHRLKARALVDRIGADLARIGVPAADESQPSGLTPREVEVLRLVGDGLTNREIGQRLFLSVRTVEMHARNGMAKLGCRTRAEAARRLSTGPASA